MSRPETTVRYGDAWLLANDLAPASIDCIVTSPPYWGLRDYGHPDQFGLERTPQEYVAKLVELFARLRPALKDEGTVWLNLGDSYASDTKGSGGGWANDPDNYACKGLKFQARRFDHGLKPKDLCGIPWRVAFALQDDGWYLRSDIIWAKPNPMPESVTDRPTKAHEYVFLLSKSERYYFDQEAVMEPAESGPSDVRKMLEGKDRIGGIVKEQTDPRMKASALTNSERKRSVGGKALTSPRNDGDAWNENDGRGFIPTRLGRNIRTVWTISTKPYSGAHFATMPPELAERCIKAGCPEGGTVLDPFAGSGTTLYVARKLGRNSIGFELNEAYKPLIDDRLKQGVLL